MKERFDEVSKSTEERLGHMETALPLAQRFQDAHDRLNDWVQQIEPDLRGKEPAGVEAEEQLQVLEILKILKLDMIYTVVFKGKNCLAVTD